MPREAQSERSRRCYMPSLTMYVENILMELCCQDNDGSTKTKQPKQQENGPLWIAYTEFMRTSLYRRCLCVGNVKSHRMRRMAKDEHHKTHRVFRLTHSWYLCSLLLLDRVRRHDSSVIRSCSRNRM